MDQETVARRVIETTQVMAEGYRDVISQWTTPEGRDKAEAAATAVHNAGIFILMGLGFSMDEIRQQLKDYRQKRGW